MIWIIASLPFWIVGIILLFLSCGSVCLLFTKEWLAKPNHEYSIAWGFSGFMFLASGVLLLIAAKVAS